jgi:hypothetical protein
MPLYPDFALPHKRYVRQDVFALSGRYLSDDAVSYSKAVRVNGMPVCYDDPDGHILWPSTVHRWIGFLGDLKHTLRQAWQLIRAKSPTCDAFRRIVSIPCWKYRSAASGSAAAGQSGIPASLWGVDFHLLGDGLWLALSHDHLRPMAGR